MFLYNLVHVENKFWVKLYQPMRHILMTMTVNFVKATCFLSPAIPLTFCPSLIHYIYCRFVNLLLFCIRWKWFHLVIQIREGQFLKLPNVWTSVSWNLSLRTVADILSLSICEQLQGLHLLVHRCSQVRCLVAFWPVGSVTLSRDISAS